MTARPSIGRRAALRRLLLRLLRRDRAARAPDTVRAIAAGFPFDRFPDITVTTAGEQLTVRGQVTDDLEREALLAAINRIAPSLRCDVSEVTLRRASRIDPALSYRLPADAEA